METTKGTLLDKGLQDRYQVIEEIEHRLVLYQPRIFKCLDKWSGKVVILKLIPPMWKADPGQTVQLCKGLLIASELQNQSDNFLKINDISYRSLPELKGYWFVVNTEFIDWTLAEAFKHKNINYNNKIRIFYKILVAVSEMHDAGIIHTNLNPNNILISKDLQTIKISGLINNAMHKSDVYSPLQQIQHGTLLKCVPADGSETSYRALELFVNPAYGYNMPSVNPAMDIWSLGAIFAFMCKDGISLFGRSEPNFTHIFRVLGLPSPEDLWILKIVATAAIGARQSTVEHLRPHFQVKNMEQSLPLLAQMLQFQPQKRISIAELLNHAIFTKLINHDKESQLANPLRPTPMSPIAIQLPDPFASNWKPKQFKALFRSLFGTLNAFKDEKRKDLIVLAHNLSTATAVPVQIWLTTFMWANTNPVMYAHMDTESLR